MPVRYEKILRILFEKSEELGKTKIPMTHILIEGDDRRHVCEWLELNEYIQNVEYFGRDVISCSITFKAIDYFLGKR